MKVWLDGEIVDGSLARIPVQDHGLLYGDGVFEGLRVYARRIFRLEDHLDRLQVSARAIALELPLRREALRAVAIETARAYGKDDAYLRLLVTRGDGPLGLDPTSAGPGRVICMADDIRIYTAGQRTAGLSLVTASVRRARCDVFDARVKSLNYLTSVMAKGEAVRQGADDALLLNDRGLVAEASAANVFAVCGGRLATPPTSEGALEGITRRTVLEAAEDLQIPWEERCLSRVDLLGAREVFLSGTGAQIAAVRQLDGQPVGDDDRPVFERIRAAFAERTQSLGTPI